MDSKFRLLCFLTIFVSLVSRTIQADSQKLQNICPALIKNANATGEEASNLPNLESTRMGRWRVSVRSNYSAASIASAESKANETDPDAVASIWLDPFEDVNLNDGSNSYSSCAYILKQLPENTIRRGQDDDTSCHQMLSKDCVEAITSRIAYTAQWLVQTPTLGPFNNLTVSLYHTDEYP